MNKEELDLRKGIIAACRSMNALGVPYEDLKPADIATMPIKGEYGSWSGPLNPSTEWRFHLDIMRSRPEVGSVVHTHSTYATTLAICGKEIPAVHYMVAASGGPTVRVAPYATYGTEDLSALALKALEGRTCCLLRNHGVIATGANVGRALWLAAEIETLARQYYLSLAIGGAQVLPDDEIARVVEKFKNYGPKSKPTALKKAAAKAKPPAKKTAKRKM